MLVAVAFQWCFALALGTSTQVGVNGQTLLTQLARKLVFDAQGLLLSVQGLSAFDDDDSFAGVVSIR